MADHEETARRIVAALFTNGAGEKASRLVLVREEVLGQAVLKDQSRNLGGLSRDAVEDRILDVLEGR